MEGMAELRMGVPRAVQGLDTLSALLRRPPRFRGQCRWHGAPLSDEDARGGGNDVGHEMAGFGFGLGVAAGIGELAHLRLEQNQAFGLGAKLALAHGHAIGWGREGHVGCLSGPPMVHVGLPEVNPCPGGGGAICDRARAHGRVGAIQMEPIPMKPVVYTHSNTFHPDELLALALLRQTLLSGCGMHVVRTRDEEVLRAAKSDPETFVVDVGFEYDPDKGNFDHHQGSLSDTWPDGTPYSACGLVWRHLRSQGVLVWPEHLLNALEEQVIKRADRYDNGVGGPWPEGEMLAAYNRRGAPDQFDKALQAAGDFLDNAAHRLDIELKAEAAVRRALTPGWNMGHGILMMPDRASNERYAPAAARLSGGEVTLMVVPRSENTWILITTPADPSDPFSIKTPAPEAWRGRSHEWIESSEGPVYLEFCHKNGFITIVQGTAQDALRAARCVVAAAHPDLPPRPSVRP